MIEIPPSCTYSVDAAADRLLLLGVVGVLVAIKVLIGRVAASVVAAAKDSVWTGKQNDFTFFLLKERVSSSGRWSHA